MRGRTEVAVRAGPGRVFDVVGDLATWPSWIEVAQRARPDGPRAWRMSLGVSLGPVDLAYDVRMALVASEHGRHLRFERAETDGRTDHSAVVIEVVLVHEPASARVLLDLQIDKRIPLLRLQRELDRRRVRTAARLQTVLDERSGD